MEVEKVTGFSLYVRKWGSKKRGRSQEMLSKSVRDEMMSGTYEGKFGSIVMTRNKGCQCNWTKTPTGSE